MPNSEHKMKRENGERFPLETYYRLPTDEQANFECKVEMYLNKSTKNHLIIQI